MLQLVFVNLFRNPLRTFLTMASVTVAIFLFCSLGGVLDTLQEAIEVGSETRLITRNKVSLIFPLPMAYRTRLEAVPGVSRVATSNWFGGTDPKNPREFFAQFAVDPNYFAVYRKDMNIIEASPAQAAVAIPDGADPKLAAYFLEQNACVVGEKLMLKRGWKVFLAGGAALATAALTVPQFQGFLAEHPQVGVVLVGFAAGIAAIEKELSKVGDASNPNPNPGP